MSYSWGRGYSSTHLGVDLVASSGTPVHAIEGGTVAYAADTRQDPAPPSWSYWQGRRGAAGIAAMIDTDSGRRELYVHLSRLTVARGQRIRAGDVVGMVGATGYAFGAHLHFGVIAGGRFVNPETIWTRAQLLAAAAGQGGARLVGADPGQRALEQLRSIGISTDPAHVFTADEALRIATQLYGVSGSTAEAIAATLTGKTVQWFVDRANAGDVTNTSPDPFTAIADAIAGIPAALTGLVWLVVILGLIVLGLYVTLSPGGSDQ